MIDIQNDDLLI